MSVSLDNGLLRLEPCLLVFTYLVPGTYSASGICGSEYFLKM